jgi:hypothetical protein
MKSINIIFADRSGIGVIKTVALSLSILFALSVPVSKSDARPLQSSEQDKAAGSQQSNQSQNNPSRQVASAKEVYGPSADSIRPYKPAGRDPFKKVVKPKPKPGSPRQALVRGFPALDVRRAEFRQRVDMARSRNLSEPDPVSQYLVSELDILGVFRDEQGFGAFVRAQPTGTMFFIRRGTQCYNGEVLRMEGDDSDIGSTKVLFREVSYVEVNGKQSPQERVVAKLPGSQQKN